MSKRQRLLVAVLALGVAYWYYSKYNKKITVEIGTPIFQ